MTSEPPRTTRRTRPDAGFRRRALLRDPESTGTTPPDDAVPASTAPRESFKETLARIPDLEVEPPIRAAAAATTARPAARTTSDPKPEELPEAAPDGAPGQTPGADDIWAPASPVARAAAAATAACAGPGPGAGADVAVDAAAPNGRHGGGDGGGRSRRVVAAPPRPPTWRRVAFGITLVALVAAIPVLGRTGYRLVAESTDGTAGNNGAAPGEPGYEELVTSTPTAVVVQTNAEGKLAALTFLALGSADGGGTVIYMPLETVVRPAGFGIDSLRSAYEVGNREADDAAAAAGVITGQILNVGIDEVIQLDDRSWAEQVAPVAPLAIDNLDPVTIAGLPLPAGPIELSAAATGPYLGTLQEGESELGLLTRQEQVWRSWLAAVAASPNPDDAVPGSATTGMGLFARTLAAGPVSYNVLPATQIPAVGFEPEMFDPDKDAVRALVADAVPAPDPALVGSRRSFRLLNGVAAGPIPLDLIRQVTSIDGSVVVIGNGPSFDFERTTITYQDPAEEDYAKLVQAAIGSTGKVALDRDAPDDIDLTVIYGRDLLDPDAVPSSTTAAAVDPTSTTAPTTATQPGGP